jgi:hypothetical protein
MTTAVQPSVSLGVQRNKSPVAGVPRAPTIVPADRIRAGGQRGRLAVGPGVCVAYLGLPTQMPRRAPARALPQEAFDLADVDQPEVDDLSVFYVD